MYFKISFGFCAMVFVLAWLEWKICLCFLISVIVHEAGHLIALKCHKVDVKHIRFSLSGASIGTAEMNYQTEILCTATGPMFSFLLGFVVLRSVPEMALISLMLGLLNCLPLYPLDGGRILKNVLHLCCGVEKAEKIVHIVTYIFSGVLMLFACWGTVLLNAGIWPIFAVLVLLCRLGEWEK